VKTNENLLVLYRSHFSSLVRFRIEKKGITQFTYLKIVRPKFLIL